MIVLLEKFLGIFILDSNLRKIEDTSCSSHLEFHDQSLTKITACLLYNVFCCFSFFQSDLTSWYTNRKFPFFSLPGPRAPTNDFGSTPGELGALLTCK